MIGRKRTFMITIGMMGGATIGVGCLPTYAAAGIISPIALFCLRILQGLSAGGEYTGALTYVAEYSPAAGAGSTCHGPQRRQPLACSCRSS
ncbi:MFS transporter [Cupriavidus sp. TMH.W2]|uniref:MFS transporter n=1 Tax=Cupriavidus sp. TMH.W2 TaxID=3434465 RepID=UPI003D78B141